ncbi:MAG: 50S ribosomal protein L1 [Opitutales bacterium]|jgi:large subunit ribosomal protein L1
MNKNPSKRYKEAAKVADLAQTFAVNQAAEILKKMPSAKFDETVEVSACLGVDPKQSDQMVRGTVSLPNGSGKKIKVIVFTENAKEALDAGADHAGLNDLIDKVNGGWMDFDVAISTTPAMKDVRKVARVLGPRGLMPNPKSGTVTDDVPKTIKEVKAGRVEFKMDKTANVVIVVGKKSFGAQQLAQNIEAALGALAKSQPAGFVGTRFVKSVTLSSTMSPGISLDLRAVTVAPTA